MVFVSLGYSYDKDLTEHVVLPRSQIGERLMLAAFVCLTILIGLILMWLTTAYYKMFVNSTKTARKSLYQATVLVFCCANVFNFGVFVIACFFKHPNLHTTDEVVVTASIHFKNGHDSCSTHPSSVSDSFCCLYWPRATPTLHFKGSSSNGSFPNFDLHSDHWSCLHPPLCLPTSLHISSTLSACICVFRNFLPNCLYCKPTAFL